MSIALFALGGTISVSGRAKGKRLTGAEITAAVPGLDGLGVTLDVRDVHAAPSGSLTFAQVLGVVEAASGAVAEGAAGVVVTQGTDTLEETAFLVDLVWEHEAPFVLTGAMRQPGTAGADGPANVLAAARVAASPAARGLGALVAFNDEVHAARWVRKSHSTSTAAFASPNAGPVGHVIEGEARILAAPPRPAVPPSCRPVATAHGSTPPAWPCTASRSTTTGLSWQDSPRRTAAWWWPASASGTCPLPSHPCWVHSPPASRSS